MARTIRPSKGPYKTTGYVSAHRRANRKANKNPAPRAIDDVYEYAPSKVRRAHVALAFDRHEVQGRRHDAEDDVAMNLGGLGKEAMDKLRARLMREDGDDQDEGNDDDDDEDIDSEDAFEESDREAFAGSEFVRQGTMRGRSKKKVRVEKEVGLNEDSDVPSGEPGSASEDEEDEEMDDEGSGGYFDILDVFDGRANMDEEEDAPPQLDMKPRNDRKKETAEEDETEWKGTEGIDLGVSEDESEDRDVEEEEEDDDDDDDDGHHISASDIEDPSPEALADLETYLFSLDPAVPHKRKPDGDPGSALAKRRRVAVTDRTEVGEEHEFGVRGASTLNIDDLLTPLASSASLAALKKSTKPLTSSNAKTKTLAAPLHQRAQERLDREAAYEKTKEEVDKWSAAMKRIKEAEHLSFPLQAEKPTRVSNLALAANFVPSTALESAVDTLLKSAQLRDEDIERTESLKMAHLTVEEVAARRAELRMMRELAFRADRKAKRVAKIKSKAYRRLRKRHQERLDEPGVDADGDGDEERELKAEVKRARERATLRHAHTGKWARGIKGREGLELDQRQAIGEMLERGEKLRRRIRGEESGDEVEDGESDGSGSDEEDDETAIKRGAFEELAALHADGDSDAEPTGLKQKSVFNMKFMRDADARRSRQVDEQVDAFEKEMGFEIGSGDGEPEDDEDHTGDGDDTVQDVAQVQRAGGRLSFHPGVLRQLGSLASDTSSVTLQSADLLQDAAAPDPTPTPSISVSGSTPTPTSTPVPVSNPWLVPTTTSGPSRKRNEVRVHKDADVMTKSSNKLKKRAERHEDERERARDDAVLEIDTEKVLTAQEPTVSESTQTSGTGGKKRKGKGKEKAKEAGSSTPVVSREAGAREGEDESDDGSEVEAQERAEEEKGKRNGKGMQAFQQRDLVALAFAGDNVVQAFEEAKRQEVEADAPHVVDTTLPGWGSWGGTGTHQRPPRPAQLKPVPGITPTARADHAKPHLIVSEKRDKKAAKYLVRELPHPYTSHAQFERRMQVPLGSEWNTRVGFQRGTMPRVVTKMGTVIDPLEKLF